MVKTSLACGAVAFAATFAACRAQEPLGATDLSVLAALVRAEQNDRPVCADRHHRRRLEAVARRPRRPRQAGGSVEDDRRPLPAPGLGGQRGDAARSCPRRDARRARAPALFPDQQGTLVAPRSQSAVRARRAAEAGGSQLLSGGRVEGRDRTLDSVAAGIGARARDRILHRRSPRADGRLYARALQHGVPERAGAHCGLAARGRGTGHGADAEDVPREAR